MKKTTKQKTTTKGPNIAEQLKNARAALKREEYANEALRNRLLYAKRVERSVPVHTWSNMNSNFIQEISTLSAAGYTVEVTQTSGVITTTAVRRVSA